MCYTWEHMSDNRELMATRLPPDLLNWFRRYSKEHKVPMTEVVETLLDALREGRLQIRPRAAPSAFPRNDIEAGSTPEYPVLIAAGLHMPAAETPDPAEGSTTTREKGRVP